MLSEGEVAGELEVSRTPVREAFLLLEAEGLLRLYPKRGALVVPVSAEEINEVLETRLIIERHCAEQIARRGPEVLVQQLRALLSDQERHIRRGNRIGFVEADRLFHRAIVSADGNSILTRLHDSLRERQRRMGAAIVARDPTRAAALPRRAPRHRRRPRGRRRHGPAAHRAPGGRAARLRARGPVARRLTRS